LREHGLGNLRVMFPLSGEAVAEARRKRWRLQTVAAKLLPDFRVSNCYRRVKDGGSLVEIRYNAGEKRAFYHGLMTCGSVWTCPVCSAKITEQRREELTQAVREWDGSLLMVTITLQHSRADKLGSLLHALKDSWRRLKMGRWWLRTRARYGLAHYVSSTEVTYGDNGWHPHIHALFFSTLPEHELDKDKLQAELTARYTALLAKHGMYASDFYGIDVRLGDEHAGEYASKYGLERELTKSIGKNGRGGYSPFQLLELYRDGDEQAGARFQEYARVFFGARQLVWSRGARDALGLGDELADEEIAEADESTADEVTTLVVLTSDEYKRIVVADIRGEVLEIASSGDAAYLRRYLKRAVGLSPPVLEFA